MTLVRGMNSLGAILIIIDSILEIFNVMGKGTPIEVGFLTLLLGVLILFLTPQLEYDYKVQWAAAVLTAQWFAHSYLHDGLTLGNQYQWASGLGFIGIIFVILAGIFVILGASLGVLVVQNIGLFKPYRYFLFGVIIIVIHNSISFTMKITGGVLLDELSTELLSYIFIAIMLLGTVFIWRKKKIAGSLLIWISNALNSVFTGINGFYAGAALLSVFGFILVLFAFLDHWADPYTRKTRIPRRDLSMAIKDSFSWLMGIMFYSKNKKLKKLEQEVIQ